MNENAIREDEHKATTNFTCSVCGGDIEFDPESQGLVCKYCGNKETIENKGVISERSYVQAIEEEPKADWGMKTRVIKCDDCGGETIMDDNAVSKVCVFCGSPHVIKQSEFKGIKPESLVPFQISKKAALDIFEKWLKKRKYAPSYLKKEYRSDKIKGMYIPVWTYNTFTLSSYTAEAGKHFYIDEEYQTTENGKPVTRTRKVKRTSFKEVAGRFHSSFKNILINASKGVAQNRVDRLEPFDLKELVSYNPKYLAGYFAERYSINLKDGWKNAKVKIERMLESQITQSIEADEVRKLEFRTEYKNVTFKHLLLPVWISSYRYRNKSYSFMINGQTGKVVGKFPVSVLKVLMTILIVLGVAAAIYFLFMR